MIDFTYMSDTPKEKPMQLVDVKVKLCDDNSISISPVWSGVDRPDTGGWNLGQATPKKWALADRLLAAIRAGKAVRPRGILKDSNGQTYVDAEHQVLGRRMNADLKRLGF